MVRVLVPVDGSGHDAETLAYLSKLFGGRQDVEFLLFHAIDLQLLPPTTDPTGMPVFLPPSEIEALQQTAQESAQRTISGAAAEAQRLGLKTQTEVHWGDPANLIVDRAVSDGKFDMIAMGSRGAGQIAGIFLGSVSDRVVHRAQVPVLVVH